MNKVSHERIGGLDSSPEALGVVWELLTATLNIHEDEDVVGCHEDVLGEAIERHKDPAVLVRKVRWYDARSRIAIKMVAEWLRLPWKRVLNLEVNPWIACHLLRMRSPEDVSAGFASLKGGQKIGGQGTM